MVLSILGALNNCTSEELSPDYTTPLYPGATSESYSEGSAIEVSERRQEKYILEKYNMRIYGQVMEVKASSQPLSNNVQTQIIVWICILTHNMQMGAETN